MDNKTLTEYVKTEKEQGMPPKFIYQKALESGWTRDTIAASFREVYGNKLHIWNFMFGKFSDLFEETIKIFSKNYKLFMGIGLASASVSIFFWILELVLFPGTPYEGLPEIYRLVSQLITSVVQFMAAMVSIYAVTKVNEGIDIKTAFKESTGKTGKYFLTILIETLIGIVGIIALFLPGIIFFIYSSFSLYLVFTEDIWGFSAIKRSFFYVKGFFLMVAARLFSWGVFIMFAGWSFGLIVKTTGLVFLERPVSALVSNLFMAIPQIYVYLMYLKTKEIKTELYKP